VFSLVTDVQLQVTIEWSWDGEHVDANEEDTVTPDLSPYGAETKVKAPYMRVRITNNSGSDQATMRFRLGGRVI
jgi:hypothetical protein